MNLMKKLILKNYSLFLLVFLVASCSPKPTSVNHKAKDFTIEDLINLSEKNTYSTLHYKKININVESPSEKQTLYGDLKIRKDSLILISLRAGIGLEIARVALLQDSVFIINRVKKEYIKTDYQFIEALYGMKLNFVAIQNLLSGSFFIGNNTQASQYKMIRGNNFLIHSENLVDSLIVYDKSIFDSEGRQIEKEITYKNKNTQSIFYYSNFVLQESKKYPKNIRGILKKSNFSYKFNFEISDILVDHQLEYSFSINSRYTESKISF